MDVLDLAGTATAELVTRTGLDPNSIDLAIYGAVLPALYAPNLGREVVFRCSLPEWIPGSGVSLACASSNRAITSGAEAILVGQADVVLAGGAEALSKVPIRFSDAAAKRKLDGALEARACRRRRRRSPSCAPRTWCRCRPPSPSTRQG